MITRHAIFVGTGQHKNPGAGQHRPNQDENNRLKVHSPGVDHHNVRQPELSGGSKNRRGEAKVHQTDTFFGYHQAMEQVGDYPAAVRYYREALALEPTKTFTWYFINNNLGFSLNTLGQFSEGEVYCRKALEIDASRPNAYKNLGISLAGQAQYQEAFRFFIAATQADATDGRAFRLLQDLLKQHPELAFEFQDAMECCQKAVEVAAKRAEEHRPKVYRGWKKQLILLWSRIRRLFGQAPGSAANPPGR